MTHVIWVVVNLALDATAGESEAPDPGSFPRVAQQ